MSTMWSRALLLIAATLSTQEVRAQQSKCHAPTKDSECPKDSGYKVDCLTQASGKCVPDAWRSDEFCDTRLMCGTNKYEDKTCKKFCRDEKCLPTHKDSSDSGGLFVTDVNTARVLAYVPTTLGKKGQGVSSAGEYKIAMEAAGLEEFRLNGETAVGIGRNSDYVYAITSSKTDHKLYGLNRLTGEVTNKTLNNFPKGWVKTQSSTPSTWRYKLPESMKSAHPCRCTGADTGFKQGSGLPWSTGLRAAETLASDAKLDKHTAQGYKSKVDKSYWPKDYKDSFKNREGKGELGLWDTGKLAKATWRQKAGYQTAVVSPFFDLTKNTDERLKLLGSGKEFRKKFAVAAYPMVHADDHLFKKGNKQSHKPVAASTAVDKGTRMCPLLEPLLCSSKKMTKRWAFGGPDYGFKTDFNTVENAVPTAPAQSAWHSHAALAAKLALIFPQYCLHSNRYLNLLYSRRHRNST